MRNSLIEIVTFFGGMVQTYVLWGGLIGFLFASLVILFLAQRGLLSRNSLIRKIFMYLNTTLWFFTIFLASICIGVAWGLQKGVEEGFKTKIQPILQKEFPVIRRGLSDKLGSLDPNQVLKWDYIQMDGLEEIGDKYRKDNPLIQFAFSNYGQMMTKLVLSGVLSYGLQKAGEDIDLDSSTVKVLLDILEKSNEGNSDEKISEMIEKVFLIKWRGLMYSMYMSLALPILFVSIFLGLEIYQSQKK
jgi:hypothetical protein